MTDEAGNFTLTGLPDGSYLVQAMHNDYRRSEPVTIPVTAGRGVEAVKIVLVMDQEGVISGRVVSEGEPVEGAKIEVISKNLSDSKITDSEGKFSFRGLEEGVNMTVKAQGYHERAFIGVRPGTVEMVIEVRRRGLPVTGKVRLDRLKAVSHVTVHVYQIMRDTGKERLTGVYPFFEKFPEFAFSVELLEGEYRLEFSTEGYEGVDRSVIVTDAPVEFSLKLKPLP